jgi:hypothetical protein
LPPASMRAPPRPLLAPPDALTHERMTTSSCLPWKLSIVSTLTRSSSSGPQAWDMASRMRSRCARYGVMTPTWCVCVCVCVCLHMDGCGCVCGCVHIKGCACVWMCVSARVRVARRACAQ